MPRGVYDRRKKRGARLVLNKKDTDGPEPMSDSRRRFSVQLRVKQVITVFVRANDIQEAQRIARAFVEKKKIADERRLPGCVVHRSWPETVGAQENETEANYYDSGSAMAHAFAHPIERVYAPKPRRISKCDSSDEIKVRST